MPFVANDRFRIISALNLDRCLDTSASKLAQLMLDLATFDTQNTTTYVDRVTAALDEIDTLNTAIAAQSEDIGVIEYEVQYEIRERYSSGASRTEANRRKRDKQIALIRQYLDPCDYLGHYNMAGRIIAGL